MSIGLPPKYTQDIAQLQLTQAHFIILALESIKSLNWNLRYLSEKGIIAFVYNPDSKLFHEVKIMYQNNILKISSISGGNEWRDKGRNKFFVGQFTSVFLATRSAISSEVLDLKYEEIRETLLPASEDTHLRDTPATLNIFTEFLSVFKPVHNYFVTPILLNLNLIIFILMVLNGANFMNPDGDTLILWGANYTPFTLSGQWWRLLSCCFVHIGILHLLMNMYALLFVGVLLDPILGKTRFFIAYILTGIIGSANSLWWHTITISAGASGAIFGMYGLVLALLTTRLIPQANRRALLISIGIFVTYNLANGLKSGIDNAAHIGGLVSGFAIGLVMLPGLKKNRVEPES